MTTRLDPRDPQFQDVLELLHRRLDAVFNCKDPAHHNGFALICFDKRSPHDTLQFTANVNGECLPLVLQELSGQAGRARRMTRAHSLLTVKDVRLATREFEGVATTPTPDRLGDIVEPLGASFRLPLPLLWQHKHDQPVGHVVDAKVSARGIDVVGRLAKVTEPGTLKDRCDLAFQSIQHRLVQGLSIGFKPKEYSFIDPDNPFGGLKYSKVEILELSLVTIPAHQDATISVVRSLDRNIRLPRPIPDIKARVATPKPAPTNLAFGQIRNLRKLVWDDLLFDAEKGRRKDWDPETKTYPSDPLGVCRHKAAYLKDLIGGEIIYGYRTDGGKERHCALVVELATPKGARIVLDRDGIWPLKAFPFKRDNGR